MDIYHILSLVGGLAMFLYGMDIMGKSLERQAGGRLRGMLEKLTSNPIKGVILGTVVTAIIQSSSATTVMVVGFVNAGLLTLERAVGVIMGANIGTAATAWILSLTGIQSSSFAVSMLKPSNFSPILAAVGIVMIFFAKRGRRKEVGHVLLGFAILMFGMQTMSGAVEPLAEMESFRNVLLLFSNPFFGVLIGTAVTAIIQSSSASVGILQAMSMTGSITYSTAIPIIMGQNIGTCVTALISCIGANTNAKRAAFVHLYFNVIGVIIFLSLYYAINAIIGGFAFNSMAVNALSIAVIHTVFKLFNTAIMLPMNKMLIKLACLTVRGDPEDEAFTPLDDRLLATPSVAISQCNVLTGDMAKLAKKALDLSMSMVFDYNEDKARKVMEYEDRLDMFEDKLGTYLVKISEQSLTSKDSHEASTLLHCIGDFERIGDHAVNILESSKEMDEKKIRFSDSARAELKVLTGAVGEIVDMAVRAFMENDIELALLVEPLEEVVDNLRADMKNRHIERLQKGNCTIELGFIYSDLITNLERVADHCSNIAICLIQIGQDKYDAHAYLTEMRASNDPEFTKNYELYRRKYSLADN